MSFNDNPNPNRLRVIKTARDERSINRAAREGFRPLVKLVKQSDQIRSKFCVWQHRSTGEIRVFGDFRAFPDNADEWQQVVGWTDYYPDPFPSPFAAYLIPSDIQVNEQVFVEDLIEDLIGASWNQGDVYRLKSCEAVWNGSDLVIQYEPTQHRRDFVG